MIEVTTLTPISPSLPDSVTNLQAAYTLSPPSSDILMRTGVFGSHGTGYGGMEWVRIYAVSYGNFDYDPVRYQFTLNDTKADTYIHMDISQSDENADIRFTPNGPYDILDDKFIQRVYVVKKYYNGYPNKYFASSHTLSIVNIYNPQKPIITRIEFAEVQDITIPNSYNWDENIYNMDLNSKADIDMVIRIDLVNPIGWPNASLHLNDNLILHYDILSTHGNSDLYLIELTRGAAQRSLIQGYPSIYHDSQVTKTSKGKTTVGSHYMNLLPPSHPHSYWYALVLDGTNNEKDHNYNYSLYTSYIPKIFAFCQSHVDASSQVRIFFSGYDNRRDPNNEYNLRDWKYIHNGTDIVIGNHLTPTQNPTSEIIVYIKTNSHSSTYVEIPSTYWKYECNSTSYLRNPAHVWIRLDDTTDYPLSGSMIYLVRRRWAWDVVNANLVPEGQVIEMKSNTITLPIDLSTLPQSVMTLRSTSYDNIYI